MDSKDVVAEFSGFGPIPSTKTTFAQGIGMGGSFAPVWTMEPQLPARRQTSQQVGLNFNNGYVQAHLDLTDHSADFYLSDISNCTWVESKIDTTTKKATVYGFSGCENENFLLEADSVLNTTILSLYDSGNANYLASKVDSTSVVSVNGYSNNQDQNFLLQSSSVDAESKLELFDSGSQEYLLARVNIDSQVSQIVGYANNLSQNFEILADGINNKSHIALSDTESAEQIFIEIDDSGYAKVNGTSGGGSQNFSLNANDADGKSTLQLFDSETVNGILLQEKADDTKIYMNAGDNYVLIDFPKNGTTVLDAYWQEIDICVDGVAKKMQVLGTEPYDLPAP